MEFKSTRNEPSSDPVVKKTCTDRDSPKQQHGPAIGLFSLCGWLLLVDQLTKWAAAVWLQSGAEIASWNRLVVLTYAENSGAFLSLGTQWSPAARFGTMIVFNGLLLVLLSIWLLKVWSSQAAHRSRWGWGLVLAGGLGNLIDRLVHHGHVIDFINIGVGPLRSGIFNVADLAITLGIGWLLLHSWRSSAQPNASKENLTHSTEPITRSITTAKLVICTLSASGFLLASQSMNVARADRVEYQTADRAGRIGMTGEILDYDSQTMEFRSQRPDKIHMLDAKLIVRYDASLIESHKRAQKAQASRQFADAYRQAEQALKLESRPWVRRELLALQTEAAVNQQNWQLAAQAYLAMLKNSPKTRHREVIPLAWQIEPLDPSALKYAQDAILSDVPAERLIGSSWLLNRPGWQPQANAVLDELLLSSEPWIRELARCQLWRARLQADNFNDGDLKRWERQLGDLSTPFKAGPMFLLGRGYARRVQPAQAAARYLWLTVMDSRNNPLALLATKRAADLLESIGQTVQAAQLRDEATRRFILAQDVAQEDR